VGKDQPRGRGEKWKPIPSGKRVKMKCSLLKEERKIEAFPFNVKGERKRDRFVASLLAMTEEGAPHDD